MTMPPMGSLDALFESDVCHQMLNPYGQFLSDILNNPLQYHHQHTDHRNSVESTSDQRGTCLQEHACHFLYFH